MRSVDVDDHQCDGGKERFLGNKNWLFCFYCGYICNGPYNARGGWEESNDCPHDDEWGFKVARRRKAAPPSRPCHSTLSEKKDNVLSILRYFHTHTHTRGDGGYNYLRWMFFLLGICTQTQTQDKVCEWIGGFLMSLYARENDLQQTKRRL